MILGAETKARRYEEAKRLFETAFKEQKEMRVLIGPERVCSRKVLGSKSPLKAALAKRLSIEYFPSEEPECKAMIHWLPENLPIRKGQKVGEVRIQDERGTLLQAGDLLALEEVKGSFFFMLKKRIDHLFH